MLISDTGGGHRASAQALESMLRQVRPGELDVCIVDVFTEHCPWPYNKFEKNYQTMAKNPWLWKVSWHLSAVPPIMHMLNGVNRAFCAESVARMFREHDPDLVVSLHPLTQALPLKVLERMGNGGRQVPFATVVTDLGSAHPWWFSHKVDSCFIPSDAIRKVAERRRLAPAQISQTGLPVRPAFCQDAKPRAQLCGELGLQTDRRTVLIVGGGDGVGSLGKIVKATATELGRECPGQAQVVAVCGKNAKVRAELEKHKWGDVNVHVCGFIKTMSDYMQCADVLVTKAGPGTIAEAAIRGLPTMLSSFLPGQEAGNVRFVTENGFGAFSRKPRVIARRVRGWIQHPDELDSMASAARAVAAPEATSHIARELLTMLDGPPRPQPAY